MKAARSTFLRQRNSKAGATSDRTSVVVLVWDDLLSGAESTKTETGDAPPVENPDQGAPRGGKRQGKVASPSCPVPPVRLNPSIAPRHVTFASSETTRTRPVPA